jgi:hypothetical protein
MRGFPHPWWLVGGHAIEAFTGISRPHDDLDISFFPEALPDFRRQVGGGYHLWSNNGGTFRLLNDEQPEPLDALAQVWVRRNAHSPWVLDVSPSPCVGGRWQSKRHPEFVSGLDEVTWITPRGLRILNPEVTLLYKARWDRAKDRFDLDAAWPLLNQAKRAWLLETVARVHPGHPWLDRLESG